MGGFFGSSLGIAALVAAVLVIIYFISPKPKLEDTNEDSRHEEQVAVSQIPSVKEEEDEKQKELELVAAIMGALSAYLEVPASKLVIKSIKRVDGNSSVWREHGLQ